MPSIPPGCRCVTARSSSHLSFYWWDSYTVVTPEVTGEQLGSLLAPAGPSPG